jgi:hypothetical protein
MNSTSSYDAKDIRLLSSAFFAALESLQKTTGIAFTEDQTSDFGRRLGQNLMESFERGERDPAALESAALGGIFVGPVEPSDELAANDPMPTLPFVATVKYPTAPTCKNAPVLAC